MKITDIRGGIVRIPLKTPFVTALRRVDTAEDLVVKVITDDGHTGWGNAPATVVITGDSHASVASAIKDTIGPQILGMDIDDREAILQRIQHSMVHNTSAKAALDIAVHDLLGQKYRLPLYRFFGSLRQRLTSDLTISLGEPEQMVRDAQKAIHSGYTNLKLKVGVDAALDIRRVRAIRQAAGPHIAIRLDANQGWTPKEAVRILNGMQERGLDLAFVEQPVKAHDFDGLKYVTERSYVPVLADESVFSPQDALTIMQMGAADLVNIKLMKCGGLYNALKIASAAEVYGVEFMFGCMLEA